MTANVLRRAKLLFPVVLLLVVLVLPATVQAGSRIHVVRRGENLTRIAIRYGTTVQAICRANGLRNANYIYAGQRLIIPSGGGHPSGRGCGCVHVVRRGETLTQIARRYGTTVHNIMRSNGLWNANRIWAGQRLCVPCGWAPPPCCGSVHVVRRGETLYSIARRYGTCVQTLAAVNHLRNPNLIWVGQRLRIP